MFSELCRETLRKAAVYYSSGRSSSSPSPSPPSSPTPSSPKLSVRNQHYSKDVGYGSRTHSSKYHQYHQSKSHFSRRSLYEIREKRKATPTNLTSRRTSGLESRDGRRLPYAATIDYSSYASTSPSTYTSSHSPRHRQQYPDHHQRAKCHRRGRSAPPEMLRSISLEDKVAYQKHWDSSGSESESEDDLSTSGDEAGTASDENSQRSNSAHNRHSLTKEQTMHWFARIGSEDYINLSDIRCRSNQFDADSLDGDHPCEYEGRDSTGGAGNGVGLAKDLDRAKLVRDRQNEERQRKLEELRQQALAAQRFREQREEERRRRIEELRTRDYDRRSQVEERKRLIWEAERERREAILRKNQEREARIEAKRKNERSHIVFAFGSSTPRMLEPADTGGASFWGTRRATSTTNVMTFSAAQPLTRRSSERELDGSKKRATSAGGLDRKPGEDMRMSSSMYEVFNWNCTPDPHLTPAKNKRASLSLAPTIDIFSIDDMSMINDARRPMIHKWASGEEAEATDAGTPSPSSGVGGVTRFANRRRTDLMPTIPSPRDREGLNISGGSGGGGANPPTSGRSSSAKSFTRSPGRTYSMSRLDQLAQPRRRTLPLAAESHQQFQQHPQHPHQQQQSLAASSMSRSMSHLAAAPSPRGVSHGPLKRTDNSRSMGTLPGSGVVGLVGPRPTRAERLRRKAREHQSHATQSQALNQAHSQVQVQQQSSGIRSGEATPNSPSRPHSSMSQQSATSSVASSTVNLRPRTGTPRRPRPASIAGTGVSVAVERNNSTGDSKVIKDSKPPLPKIHNVSKKLISTPTPPASKTSAERKPSTDKSGIMSRSTRVSPRVTPKATPLQSPGVEHPALTVLDPKEFKQKLEFKDVKKEANDEKTQENMATELIPSEMDTEKNFMSEVLVTASETTIPDNSKTANESQNLLVDIQVAAAPSTKQVSPTNNVEKKDELKAEKKSSEAEAKNEIELDEQCDMTASMIQKIRITTEEEAKAALAERRRLAREQAEREAELERQRLEEEARLEAERLQAEEEEQRRLEEETLRLAEEAREAEEQRLRLAIEEAKKREEEDRKRKEEEAKQKQEKEEAERKAREEAEKQRLEMVERLKKEEEERNARRKRVEAIMSRTRAKYQPNVAKGEVNDGEKSKEDSPSDESKPTPGEKAIQDLMTTSLISEATQHFISGEQLAHNVESNNSDESNNGVIRNGTHANGISDSPTKPRLDNEDNNQQELNGHHHNTNHGNGIDGQMITLDNATVKHNNVTNNRLDLSDFDTLSNSNSSPILLMQPTGLANEDNLNSNLNPTAVPFTPSFSIPNVTSSNPFQDVFTNNKQQENPVPDLLS